jgi:hypothetical protein
MACRRVFMARLISTRHDGWLLIGTVEDDQTGEKIAYERDISDSPFLISFEIEEFERAIRMACEASSRLATMPPNLRRLGTPARRRAYYPPDQPGAGSGQTIPPPSLEAPQAEIRVEELAPEVLRLLQQGLLSQRTAARLIGSFNITLETPEVLAGTRPEKPRLRRLGRELLEGTDA